MVKNHLKRIASPKQWKIVRKESKFVTRINAGKAAALSLPLNVALRDVLKLVKTNTEAKKVVEAKNIIIGGRRRTDLAYPVGFLDVLEIKETKEYFRLSLSSIGHLQFVAITAEEANVPAKIIGKNKIAGKTQLNMYNGLNIIVDKDTYKTNDSLLLTADNKIKAHLPLKEKAKVIVAYGKNIGKSGSVESITGHKIKIKTKDEAIETIAKNVFVIGDEKSTITI